MTVGAVFSSHSPLRGRREPAAGVSAAVAQCEHAVAERVAAFAPDTVIAIGPDHFNGLFYRLMPAFCVGAEASSVGDWDTPAGPLPTDPALAEACVRHLHEHGVDAAVSYRQDVDHGVTQLLDNLFDWRSLPAVVPLVVNCAAPPLPPLARVQQLGAALGAFAAALPGRVLLLASGGLSHDPPIPALTGATPAVRERLIAGGPLDARARAAREARVLEAAEQGAGVPLNPDWDRRVLEALCSGDTASVLALDDAEISREGGCGAHEIRTWIAAAAAARAAGCDHFRIEYYRAIPEWIAGYASMTALPPGGSG